MQVSGGLPVRGCWGEQCGREQLTARVGQPPQWRAKSGRWLFNFLLRMGMGMGTWVGGVEDGGWLVQAVGGWGWASGWHRMVHGPMSTGGREQMRVCMDGYGGRLDGTVVAHCGPAQAKHSSASLPECLPQAVNGSWPLLARVVAAVPQYPLSCPFLPLMPPPLLAPPPDTAPLHPNQAPSLASSRRSCPSSPTPPRCTPARLPARETSSGRTRPAWRQRWPASWQSPLQLRQQQRRRRQRRPAVSR